MHVGGTDLVRDDDGRYLVLEDNLRTPVGRQLHAREPAGAEAGLPAALRALRRAAGRGLPARARRDAALGRAARRATRAIVLLTPGSTTRPTSSTPSSRGRWASRSSRAATSSCTTTASTCGRRSGLERVDVIYRRIDDDFLDPLAFRRRLAARRRRAGERVSRRQRHARERDRHRHRRRQGDLPVRPGHDPLLPRRGAAARATCRPTSPPTTRDRAYILEHLDELVVKAVDQSGRLRHADRAAVDRGRARASSAR